ncbi:MAG TPA: thiamine pyrophosphate-binding protein [Stellaceae bacterium]|nr:thiamine pyrophosphate-binding protein [Stellaceae bacterium]
MPHISGKRAVLEILKQEGVEFIFGNPGTTELPLMDALAVEDELRYVLALQEAAVMAMADGYAQASGKLSVVSLHVTPGLGNAMGMLYDAQKAGSPILVTAGQHDQGFNVTEPILWADLPTLARPLVKSSTEVHRLADLPRVLHRAAKTALAPPTGPVFVSLPADVLKEEGEIDLLAPTRVARGMRGDRDAVAAAAALLAKAERPVIMAGDAVAQGRALPEMVALAEMLGAPVYAELIPSMSSYPTSHPLFRGTINRIAPFVRKVLEQHDLLLSIGADLFAFSLPSNEEPVPPGYPIIHLDVDPWELGKNYPAKVAILGDPKGTLPDLLEALGACMGERGRAQARERFEITKRANLAEREALHAKARGLAGQRPVQALALIEAIGQALPRDAVVIDETISSSAGLRQLIASDDAQSLFALRGGGIGWGLPATIGAKLALPNRPVVGLIGDGSAMYTCQALYTAARYKVGVVWIIFNNRSYRILKQRVNAMRAYAAQTDRFVGMDLVDPQIDYLGLARSLGVAAEAADSVADAVDLLKKGLASGAPLLIDVALDRAFKPV